MQTHSISVLIVKDNPGEVRLLEETFRETKTVDFTLESVDTLGAALERLEATRYDLIFLDVRLLDSPALEGLVQFRQAAAEIPAIILTGMADEALAMEAGRQDAENYPVQGEINSRLLVWAIHHAIKRQQQLEERDREVQQLERLARPSQAAIEVQAFGQKRLSETLPATFQGLIGEYSQILDLALEEKAYKVNLTVSDQLRILGEQLGFLKASPPDIVQLHVTSLKRKVNGVAPTLVQAYKDEGRVLLIELMGYLTSFYRSRSLGIAKVPPTHKSTKSNLNDL